jgi:ubiquinone/menaquinone biosynthesis C-methylase UbiE
MLRMFRGVENMPWVYDLGMAVGERLGLRRWRRRLATAARGRVLDLGSGTGRMLPLFAAEVEAVACDPCLTALLRARRRTERPVVVAAAERLPFADAAFDTVVSALVFCSVDDPGQGFSEMRRVMAGDGRAALLEHVRSENPLVARLQDVIQPGWTWFTGGCHPNRDTVATLRAAGFELTEEAMEGRNNLRFIVARIQSCGTVSGGKGEENAPIQRDRS